MSHTQKQVNTEIQAQQFMDRLRERKKGVVAYAAQMLDEEGQKPVISSTELEAVYDFFLRMPGLQEQLANLEPGAPTGLVFMYKDAENENLARSAEILITEHGPELIIRTGNKLPGFSADQKNPDLKREPGAPVEGAKKARRFAFRVDEEIPRAKARLQIELTLMEAMGTNDLQQIQMVINKWQAIQAEYHDVRKYYALLPAEEAASAREEYQIFAAIVNQTKEFYAEVQKISAIDPDKQCKYLDHPTLGSIYTHGKTTRKGYDESSLAMNVYSDLCISNLDLITLDPDLATVKDKRAAFRQKFSDPQDQSFIDNLEYAGDILKGLEFMHARNLLHLDIKPGNFLLDRDAKTKKLFVKLTDYGTATFADDEARLLDMYTGTPAFWGREDPNNPRSPFVEEGQPMTDMNTLMKGKADDMLATGISLYILLTGEYPRFNEYIDLDHRAMLAERPNPADYAEGEQSVVYKIRLKGYEKDLQKYENTGLPLLREQAAYTQQVLAANPLLAGLLDLNRARRLTATAALQEFDKQGGKLHFIAKPPSLKDAEARAAQPNVNVETASDNSSVVVNANPGEAEPINTESLPPLPKRKQSMAAMIFSCFPQRQVQPFNQLRIDSLLKNIDTLHQVMEEAIATSAVTPGAKGRENESEVSVKAARSDYVEQTKSDFAELRQILNDHGPNIEPEEKRRINELIKEFDTLKPRRFSFRKS